MRPIVIALGLVIIGAAPALADRPLTEVERTKLAEALKAQGCTGGRMEFDDGHFEVDDAKCADGKVYDFHFDQAFAVTRKELDD
jgi:hypothetical protein